MHDYQQQFIEFAIRRNVLRFGEFTLKSGRTSPYFFNAGLFNTGEDLLELSKAYAAALQRSGLDYDIIFGPAYKGIPLATVTAMALADPLNGRWEGYRLPGSDYLFVEAPEHKVQEMDAALSFFGKPQPGEQAIQEIPDTIGTHAVFSEDNFHTISLMEVVSWKLFADGTLSAMVAQENDPVEKIGRASCRERV